MELRARKAAGRLARVAAAAIALLGLAGCSGHSSSDAARPAVRIAERDFHIAAPRIVRAGRVEFSVKNGGPDAHELILVRAASPRLPLRHDGVTVDEDALDKSTAGALEPGQPGSVRSLKVRLSPGRYVLMCNMAGHYLGGMHVPLVVQ